MKHRFDEGGASAKKRKRADHVLPDRVHSTAATEQNLRRHLAEICQFHARTVRALEDRLAQSERTIRDLRCELHALQGLR